MRNLSPCLLGVLCASILNAQPKNDEGYTAKIREYTTESFLTTELVDHLPASATVPTPEKVLGYIVGAPNKLTYTKDIYRYMRELEKATRRVKVSPSAAPKKAARSCWWPSRAKLTSPGSITS